MVEWQVAKKDEKISRLSEEISPPNSASRYWAWLMGGFCVLLLLGGLLFHWWLVQQVEIMERHLTEFIQFEEEQRFLGLQESGKTLIGPDVSDTWREAYLESYSDPKKRVAFPVEVGQIELRDTHALVTVRINNQPQLRAYQLIDEQWRRMPLSLQIWGSWRKVKVMEPEITIHYRARDEKFAQTLVRELPLLFEQWSFNHQYQTIVIQPREFGEEDVVGLPQFKQNELDYTWLTINSPLLVPPKEKVGGEGAVRLVLADALLAEANPESEVGEPGNQFSLITGEQLPKSTYRFRAAIRSIILMRWALPPEQYVQFRQTWNNQRKWRWESPFLTDWPTDKRHFYLHVHWRPILIDNYTLLVADYLYEQIGREGVLTASSQILSTPNWDTLFYTLLDKDTQSLEEDVQRFMRDEMVR